MMTTRIGMTMTNIKIAIWKRKLEKEKRKQKEAMWEALKTPYPELPKFADLEDPTRLTDAVNKVYIDAIATDMKNEIDNAILKKLFRQANDT